MEPGESLKIDTTDPRSVVDAVLAANRDLFPRADGSFIKALFHEVEKLFTGGHPDYQANDLRYHDFRHTLQVTMAYVDLYAAYQRTAESPLTHRQFELGLAASLLHDCGYLKLRTDTEGTGAKYTYCHVLRSCALAASLLPPIGVRVDEIEIVLGAIRATGPNSTGMELRFSHNDDLLIACMVATADYLGQMAASDYPDELELLFNEFAESDAFLGLPKAQRAFKSLDQLVNGSRYFWNQIVKPKFENDYRGAYHFLDRDDGRNPYIEAIEHNLQVIENRRKVVAI